VTLSLKCFLSSPEKGGVAFCYKQIRQDADNFSPNGFRQAAQILTCLILRPGFASG
jgi:hypothetical protein